MSEAIQEVLTSLIERVGPELLTDRRRLEAFLADLCPGARREAALLGAAIRLRLPAEILNRHDVLPADVQRWSGRLFDELGIAPELAVWAVETWAAALGRRAEAARPHAAATQSAPLERPANVLEGARGTITALAFSDDGDALASADREGAVSLWSVKTGWTLDTVRGRRDVTSVACRPGDQLLAFADGPLVRLGSDVLKGHKHPVTRVAFSPDGRWLASGDRAGLVRMWQLTSTSGPRGRGERIVRQLESQGAPVVGLDFDDRGQLLGVATENGAIRIWDSASGRVVTRIDAPAALNTLIMDGTRVFAGGVDTTVHIHDNRSGDALLTLDTELPVAALALFADGVRLAVGTWEPTIQIWDTRGGLPLGRLSGHTGPISALAASPRGTHLASGSADRTIRIWEMG